MADRPAQPPDLIGAVLDTSVLVAEQRHWLWLLAQDGYYDAFWSTFIVAELVRVRVELGIARGNERAVYRARINNLVHRLSDVLRLADYRTILLGDVLPDPDDEPILATALAARVPFVVSLNTRDFPSGGTVLGVRFLTPGDFLAVLGARYPDADLTQRIADSGRHLP
ncbi:MAG TPA: PIN domain-containing protein [Chloroflexota bacterium]|nr:PIN domain-containing protein [Chloroflexota bacterium]